MKHRRACVGFSLAAAAAFSCAATPPRSAPTAAATGAPSAAAGPAPARDDSFRNHPPDAEPAGAYAPPVPRLTTLANGMGLLVVERHVTPVVAAELVVRGGTAAFPAELPATLEVMAETALGSTTRQSENDIYDAMNAHMFELLTSVGDAWLSFRVRAIAPSFDDALEVMRDVALCPSFPVESFATRRQRHLAAAPYAADDVRLLARRNLYGAVYGPSHPYTRALQTDPGALAKVTRDDVVRVWSASMDPAQSVLVVAGDVDAAALRLRVEALFGDWKAGPASLPARAPVPAPAPTATRLIVVDRPGAPQASVFYGAPIAGIAAPEHLAQAILRALLGGMRSSTFESRVRYELGATWFGSAMMDVRAAGGILWWEASVAREQSANVLAALERYLRHLRDRGPAPDELEAAKSFVLRAQPHALESAGGVAGELAQIAAYRLPLDHLSTLRARIDAVTPDAVRAAVPEPGAMKAVIVGDLASLQGALLNLGWGPIEVHDGDGKLLRTIER